ncbi:MAG: hypothetical protein IE926_01915 [Micrococcales bacterium]|nr:hypothetical protein [Micrococcales bacterium]
MAKFAALDRVIAEDEDYLTLPVPVRGRADPIEYSIPPISGRDGLFAQRMMNLILAASIEEDQPRDPDKPAARLPKPPVLDDDEERDLYERLLSVEVLEQMLADGVTWPMIQRCAITTLLYATSDAEMAEAYWQDPNPGKALRSRPASRATARSPKKAGRSGSKASRKGHKKAATSRGSGSSSAGH